MCKLVTISVENFLLYGDVLLMPAFNSNGQL